MKHLSILALSLVIGFSTPVAALASSSHGSSHDAGAKAASTNTDMAEGEIKKVDKEAGKITIKHGELKNLEMPPMTMVFRVKDAAMLDQVKAGDKVSFKADKVGGQFTVTQIEAKK